MVSNFESFISGNYDIDLIRKNKVAVFQQDNQTFYFDTSGRVEKRIQISSDSSVQETLNHYNKNGDLVLSEASDTRQKGKIYSRIFRTYENGLLVKDSNSAYFCRHYEYYANGSLKKEEWHGKDHLITEIFWFGIDTLGRLNWIVEREYHNNDSSGRLISNRTIFYNEKGQMSREEEKVAWEVNNAKTIFCPNGGSAIYHYDNKGKLVEIERTKGPSQKIKYLDNGLISEIETTGQDCAGKDYHWDWKDSYSYRN